MKIIKLILRFILSLIGIFFLAFGVYCMFTDEKGIGAFFITINIFLLYFVIFNPKIIKPSIKFNKEKTKDSSPQIEENPILDDIEETSEPKNKPSWSIWDGEHDIPSQKRKQERAVKAELKPHTLNKKDLSGEFVSASTGEIYNTTLTNCTCMSFIRDGKPCKHMYRLAYELGYMDPPKDLSYGDTKNDLKDKINNISMDAAYYLLYTLAPKYTWSYTKNKNVEKELIENNLVDISDDLFRKLNTLTVVELKEILDNNYIRYRSSDLKGRLVYLVQENNLLNKDQIEALPKIIKPKYEVMDNLNALKYAYNHRQI